MNSNNDTIAAQATPPGRGGVGIIRVSGPMVPVIANAILGNLPRPRYAEYLSFCDANKEVIDMGIALYFQAPNSFTGEDILELQGHGGTVVMDLVLERIIELGARPAQPGEFTQRAFVNNKIDLAQAEAIADLIDSSSRQAARSAMHSLKGEFSDHIKTLLQQLIDLRLFIESALDFPEEEIDFLAGSDIRERLEKIADTLNEISKKAEQGCLLREGMKVVIAGHPNAGKSSLLNALAQRESAIVTEIPGTTRDVLREQISIDGMPVHMIDTAGLRDSDDPVEQQGVKRAWKEIEQADRILLVVEDDEHAEEITQQLVEQLPGDVPVTVVYNKIDITGREAVIHNSATGMAVYLSAKTGKGVDLLCDHLKETAGYSNVTEGSFIARRRHLDALQRTRKLILHGMQQVTEHHAVELLAEDLRQAQQALSEITGEFSSDDLLGEIFSSFCIGK